MSLSKLLLLASTNNVLSLLDCMDKWFVARDAVLSMDVSTKDVSTARSGYTGDRLSESTKLSSIISGFSYNSAEFS